MTSDRRPESIYNKKRTTISDYSLFVNRFLGEMLAPLCFPLSSPFQLLLNFFNAYAKVFIYFHQIAYNFTGM